MLLTLILIHAVLMVVSLASTSLLTFAAFSGHFIDKVVLRMLAIGTGVGIGTGVVLMFMTTVDLRCVLLAAYLAVFAAAYRYISVSNRTTAKA